MKLGKELSIINKFFVLGVVFVLSPVFSFAVENSLSAIDVKQSSSGEYDIVLKLDKKAQVKKMVDSEGNLTLVVNSTLPSETMDIVYDSAADLENVIVQKKNKDNTLILFQGENISNAKVYTKELSTGVVKQINSNDAAFGNLFFIADKKVLAMFLVGLFSFFMMMLALRPREKKYTVASAKKHTNVKKNTSVNTLRNKNLVQSKNIPSINYKVNGSFSSVNANMSKPKDFVINKQYQEIEQIRKVG